MKQKIFLLAFALLITGTLLVAPRVANAKCPGGNPSGCLFSACQGENTATCQDKGTNTNPVAKTIQIAAAIIAGVVGVAAVAMIIISGITLATSGGNAEQAATARRRLTYSLVGLVVAALAYPITTFAMDQIFK